MKIVIATHNEHKLKELNEMFNSKDIELVSLNNYDIDVDDVEENGATFIENAIIKAKYVSNYIDEYVLADDSGLCLEAMDILGVKTARYRNDLEYPERRGIVYNLVKDINNKASFKCALCLITPSKDMIIVEGEAKGEIKEPKEGNGFAYDPIFYSYELNKRFSEATSKEKNSVYHRGKAVIKLLEELRKRGLINE